MFELTKQEKEQLIVLAPRLQNLKFSSVNPMVFSEQGVSMLSSVLSGSKAVQMNIEIMRSFARYRSILLENTELKKEIKALDDKLNNAFRFLLDKIDAMSAAEHQREPLGFKQTKRK